MYCVVLRRYPLFSVLDKGGGLSLMSVVVLLLKYVLAKEEGLLCKIPKNPPRREFFILPEELLNLPGKPMSYNALHIYHELDGKIKNLKLLFSNQYKPFMSL